MRRDITTRRRFETRMGNTLFQDLTLRRVFRRYFSTGVPLDMEIFLRSVIRSSTPRDIRVFFRCITTRHRRFAHFTTLLRPLRRRRTPLQRRATTNHGVQFFRRVRSIPLYL